MWTLSLITPPTADPLDPIEVEKHCRLDPDLSPQDTLLAGAVQTAAMNCETYTRRQLMLSTWELWLDSWFEEGIFREDRSGLFPVLNAAWDPLGRGLVLGGCIYLPKPPLASVVSVKYLDGSGALQTWPADATGYATEIPTGPQAQRGRIFPAYGVPWPAIRSQPGAVKVRFTCGYGDKPEDVPAGLRNGMLLEVGEMYERRELLTIGTIVATNFLTAERLWRPFRAF